MTPERNVVQFVCFETTLPRAAFVPGWVPFARTFLVQGLRHIVLSERVARGKGRSFDFISRNEWPEEAFAGAARAGRIGDGAGGPVRAVQGGTFQTVEPVPERPEPDRDKVIALLGAPNRDTSALGQAIEDAFAGVPEAQVFIYRNAVAGHQRFAVVTEVYGARGQGADIATRLETAIAGRVDRDRSTVAVYREALALPPPLPSTALPTTPP